MTIPRCRTCIHWKRYLEALPGAHPRDERVNGGICQGPELVEEFESEDYRPDRLVYPYNEGGYFWTGPDFGCVHHEPAP